MEQNQNATTTQKLQCEKNKPIQLTYEQYKQEVFNILKNKLAARGRVPFFDEGLKKMYQLLTLYFTDNPLFEKEYYEGEDGKMYFDLKKGNLIIGDCGRSKTFAMQHVFLPFALKFNPKKAFKTIYAPQVRIDFLKYGAKALERYEKIYLYNPDESKINNLYIDELGMDDEKKTQHFGTELKPIETILHERANLFQNNFKITHASSNLTMPLFYNTYDFRVYSRLFEMFNIIVVQGNKDLRFNTKP